MPVGFKTTFYRHDWFAGVNNNNDNTDDDNFIGASENTYDNKEHNELYNNCRGQRGI